MGERGGVAISARANGVTGRRPEAGGHALPAARTHLLTR